MSIRLATPDDLAAIMAIERASFPTDAWSEAMMAGELASPHGSYLVIEEAARIIGYGGVRAVSGATDADIQTIALDATARGAGRGRMLLAALLERARESGARTVFLEVRDDNPVARSLYRREGFIETGRRPRYYQPDDVDAIVMQLNLVGWDAARREVGGAAALAAGSPAPDLPTPGILGSGEGHGEGQDAASDPRVGGSPRVGRGPVAAAGGVCT